MQKELERKTVVITVSGKNHQWMQKLVGESIRRNQILSFKASPYKIFIITKGPRVALQRRSLADTSPLIKWSKDIASEGQRDIMCHLLWCMEKDTASLCCFCQECQPESNHEETSRKPKLRNILQNNWYSLKPLRPCKNRLNGSRLRIDLTI